MDDSEWAFRKGLEFKSHAVVWKRFVGVSEIWIILSTCSGEQS